MERLDAVEFYNAALDHYFVSANPDEIADLDRGVHPGWSRSGLSFKVHAAGKSGGRGAAVCRFYGVPSAGIDSHFYSANQAECEALPTSFGGAWRQESIDVFEVRLPDLRTGACDSGFTPVFRLWNQRSDSNHRFTTDFDVARAMRDRGYFWEGYGGGVAMCAPL